VEADALAALEAGDHRRTLEVLMAAYGRAVYGYCRAMLGDPERARDVLQKTFVKAFEGLPWFERRSSLRGWLFAIARHRCLDDAKTWRRWRRRATPVEDLSVAQRPEPATPADSIERGLLEDEWRRVLASCLGELDVRIRDAVVQRYVAGWSYAEIAEVTGERANTLQARVARALPSLRRCVERAGVRP
jgi:RNA polymerase sigma-70 factor (ECF subfamily)